MTHGNDSNQIGLTSSERRIWNRVAKSIQPLKKGQLEEDIPIETSSPKKAKKVSKPYVVKPSIRRTLEILNRESERQIRQGDVRIDAKCDLHYLSLNVAHVTMKRFVIRKRQEGCKCLLIITGKGHDGEGAIRRGFRMWLETDEARSLISGYSQAHYKHGGAGAFYLFLRKSKK